MIPQVNFNLVNDVEFSETIPTKDYNINFKFGYIQDKIDGLNALKQAIYMILNTQRGAYSIYSLDYGTDLDQYIGADYDFIVSDLPIEINKSLTYDNRILGTSNFQFEHKEHESIVIVKFNVSTIYGALMGEVINVNV